MDPKSYAWRCPDWKGRPWQEAVIYELHTGTFSRAGTFYGIAHDLDRLVDAGITAIELLPVAQFGGNRGWGYDGVLLYAPHTAYGGPEDLKRLVDACHERGLMVLMDVVYNHFGPDGNYLHQYAPD
ncbi:MAG TPA: malto-oligosyltrehalose trehalohydrolase, partial [Methyloceanibacter sp.]|nr:malto-oligosyltrehalose trehalohydrolase [Methyloceanibacter sp.]